MNIRADIEHLKAALASMLAAYPELADDEQLRADSFEAETDLNYIAARLLDAARDAETMQEAIEARRRELQERAARYGRKSEAMRGLILSVMEHAQLAKITLPEATLSVRDNPPRPIVVDETALPDGYCKFIRKPDMEAIKAAQVLPIGVAMSNGSRSLVVRTK